MGSGKARGRWLPGWPALTALLVIAIAAAVAHAAGSTPARAASSTCGGPYPASRDPADPLALARAPGRDPLRGARFFVPGPAHGEAAGAIAQLLGIDPLTLPAGESWRRFRHDLRHGPLAAEIARDGLRHDVAELSKIAAEPEAQRFSSFSEGGGPGAVYAQVRKVLCTNMMADPESIPLITTYFLHASLGGCPTPAQVSAYTPVFDRRVDEMAAATGRHPAVFLLELDAIGSSRCIAADGSLPGWEADLRYEIDAVRALPHTVVYVEAGYADANSPAYTARILNAIGIRRIRGFFTNDTHDDWTIAEVRWASKVSRLTHGAHFIVNTADNGRGPLRNRDPGREGRDDLCNPPGRGLGPRDTTHTGFAHADAFLWTHPPGNSSGCGGGPPAGVFWPARAIGLAERASGRLGPGFPSRPY